MPLTTSHPAAIIPFGRTRMNISALIVGSMTPDFVYFIPYCLPLSDFSHTLPGVMIICLPLGIIALAIFHYLIKYPAFALLPSNHQSRLYVKMGDYSFLPTSRFLMIAVSVIIGALTHVFWDSFTHLDGWMVERVNFLMITVFVSNGSPIYLYKILQHGSSLAGILILLFWYIGWYKKTKATQVPKLFNFSERKKLAILAIMVFIAGLISTYIAFTRENIFFLSIDHPDFFRIGFISLVNVLFLELLMFSIKWQFRMRKAEK